MSSPLALTLNEYSMLQTKLVTARVVPDVLKLPVFEEPLHSSLYSVAPVTASQLRLTLVWAERVTLKFLGEGALRGVPVADVDHDAAHPHTLHPLTCTS